MKRERKAQHELRKGIYLLPNFFTTMSLFFGFYSIVASFNGEYRKAAIVLILSTIFDGMDGRVARLTNSVSDFGVEYDSLADLVAFGVAPALLTYLWALEPFGKLGWLGSFLYISCTALRLARFNIQFKKEEKNTFTGLPSPAGAIILVSTVLLYYDFGGVGNVSKHYVFLFLIYAVALLMVSRIRFRSFKELGFLQKKPFLSMVFLLIIILILIAEPVKFIFSICISYLLYGLFENIIAYLYSYRTKLSEPGLKEVNRSQDNV